MITVDQPILLEKLVVAKEFIYTEDKEDIVAQFKEKNLSVTEYSGITLVCC